MSIQWNDCISPPYPFSTIDKITSSLFLPIKLSAVLPAFLIVPPPSSCLETNSAFVIVFGTHSSTSCSLIALYVDTSILAMTTPLDCRYSSRSLQNLFFLSRLWCRLQYKLSSCAFLVLDLRLDPSLCYLLHCAHRQHVVLELQYHIRRDR